MLRIERSQRSQRIRSVALAFSLMVCTAMHATAATYVVTVAGLGGEPDYDQRFTGNAKDLDKIFKDAGSSAHSYALYGDAATAESLKKTLATIAQQATATDDFVLILIGHGSFDGTEYKFNLVGPDLTAAEIAALCDRIPARRQLIVDTTSSSGGAAAAFERSGRAIIAATKSGTEKNATVFARYWVESLQDPAADVDKNGAVTAMEAFTYATKKTSAFYDSQKRLATEHAVFNDIGHGEPVREAGNGQGQLLSTLTLVRYGGTQSVANDPAKQVLIAKKEELEQRIDTLKYGKAAMDPSEYRQKLTAALLELARVQAELDK